MTDFENKNLENILNYEKDKKNKEELEKQTKKVEKEQFELKKEREKQLIADEIRKKLQDIKFDLENTDLDIKNVYQTITQIIENNNIGLEEIKKVVEEIDEINEIIEKENIVPKELLFTKEDYLQAFNNEEKKQTLLKKIDQILDITTQKFGINDRFVILAGFFLSTAKLMDKNVKKIHDNCIDVKNTLV